MLSNLLGEVQNVEGYKYDWVFYFYLGGFNEFPKVYLELLEVILYGSYYPEPGNYYFNFFSGELLNNFFLDINVLFAVLEIKSLIL